MTDSPDPRDRLPAALAGCYTLERELGRGGMATVWLARDLKHDRPVALKVLRPQIAQALGPDRFLREITLTARLTHPHILPLHDSGVADGFLFYVMPYVEGESLRDRLNREKQLPLDDAVHIAREVADALTYAHSHDVIHRDIKPENILLEAGHAVVADFGIARAITAAGGDRLTETGIAVGTPTYMSPEQASGVKEIDGRSDLYSLGCVLYEMLAGQPPFVAPTGQGVMHQHLTAEPRAITELRPSIPAPIAAVLQRALSKNPADRFNHVALFADALRAPERHRQQRRPARSMVAAVIATSVAIVVAWGSYWFVQSGRPGTVLGEGALTSGDMVLLADFRNATVDSTLADAVREALRAALADLRVVRLLDPATVRDALARMGRPATTRLDEDMARELAERENAKAYLAGEVSRLGTGYQFSARVIGVADGRLLRVERVTARGDDEVITAVDRLAGRLRRGLGESARNAAARPALARVTTPSLPALRAYSVGLRLFSQGRQAEALPFFVEAVALDTGFASAYRLIGAIHGNLGAATEATEARERAYRLRDRLPESERLQAEAMRHTGQGEYGRAELAFRRLVELEPRLEGWSAIQVSDIRLHQHRWVEAESLALSAVAIRPNWVPVANAMEAQVALGRLAAAESLLGSVALEPPMRRRLSVSLLFAERDWGALTAYGDSLPPWSSAVLAALHGSLGKAEAASASLPPLFSVQLALCFLRYGGDTAAAQRMIGRYRSRVGWDTLGSAARPYARLIPVLAEIGDTVETQRLLAEWTTLPSTDPWLRSDLRGALGAIALAEGQFDSAAAHFLAWHAAPYASGQHETNRGLAEAGMTLDRAGRPDTAIALYERALNAPAFEQPGYEMQWYPLVLRRLGELYAARGDRTKAIASFRQFIELWRDADPALQPQVAEARRRLASLLSEARTGHR